MNYNYLLYTVQEAVNMVMPAMQLAGKIPDVHVQLWASALLKGIVILFVFHFKTHVHSSLLAMLI